MRFIPFTGDVSRRKVEWLLSSLQDSGRSVVIVDSPGGEFEFFSQLAPSLARTGFTAVGRQVSSAAIVLQLLGSRRLALPDATYFFHEVRAVFGPDNELSVYDLERAIELEREAKRRWTGTEREFVMHWHSQAAVGQAWLLSFIAERTGFPPGRFVNLMRNNVTLSAREAVQYGIVERIVSAQELLALAKS